tara:strand:- start:1357 stop:2400 length:1044 start_codon:yes stop_codon:yes gene_type:complete
MSRFFHKVFKFIINYINLNIPPSKNLWLVECFPSNETNGIEFTKFLISKKRNVYHVFKKTNLNLELPKKYLVKKFSLKYWAILFRSKYILFTHGIMVNKFHKSQVVVNLWHCYPFKNMKSKNRLYDINFNYIISYGKMCTDEYVDCFNINSKKSLEFGSPRWDVLRNINQPKKSTEYIAWIPTYRNSKSFGKNGAGTKFLFDYKFLKFFNQFLYLNNLYCKIKLHPMENVIIDFNYTNIEILEEGVDLNLLLYHSAALITDISSVMVDYLILNKPIYLFFPDLEEYISNRGITESFKKLIPYSLKNKEDLIYSLKNTNFKINEKLELMVNKELSNCVENTYNFIKNV